MVEGQARASRWYVVEVTAGRRRGRCGRQEDEQVQNAVTRHRTHSNAATPHNGRARRQTQRSVAAGGCGGMVAVGQARGWQTEMEGWRD